MRSKVSRNFVLLAPPSCGEVSANKSANVGALIFIVTLFGSVLIIAYHPPFVQRFPKIEHRGGAREGAGRKGLGNTKRVSICLADELVPVFKQLGGAKWLRCELERVA